MEHALTHAFSSLLIAGLLAVCLKRRPAAAVPAAGPRTFRVHRAWFVFTGVGALILVGIFVYAGLSSPGVAGETAVASAIATALLGLLAAGLARASVRVDGPRLVCRPFVGTREVDLRLVRSVRVEGLVTTVAFRVEAEGARPARPLRILAAFRDLSDLLDLLRSHEGGGPPGPLSIACR